MVCGSCPTCPVHSFLPTEPALGGLSSAQPLKSFRSAPWAGCFCFTVRPLLISVRRPEVRGDGQVPRNPRGAEGAPSAFPRRLLCSGSQCGLHRQQGLQPEPHLKQGLMLLDVLASLPASGVGFVLLRERGADGAPPWDCGVRAA